MRWVALIAPLAGCFDSRLVYCENGAICPETLVCTERTPTVCGTEEDVAFCKTMPDRTACSSTTRPLGTCSSGICSDCAPELVECRYKGEWKLTQAPTLQQLAAVWVVADDNVYAAGAAATVLHYDGTRWNLLPPPATASNLEGIWASAAGDVIVIAQDGTAYRRDNDAWTTITPLPQFRLRALWGHAIDFVVAVGDYDMAAMDGVVQHYDGSVWTRRTSNLRGQLFAVSGTSATHVVATGSGGRIVQYDGASWSAVPGTPITGANVVAAWTSDTTIFTAGYKGPTEGAIWKQQGATFIEQPFTTMPVAGLWGTADDDVYGVGAGGAIFHYDGASWSAMTSPTDKPLKAISGTATSVFAVGDAGTILRYSPP